MDEKQSGLVKHIRERLGDEVIQPPAGKLIGFHLSSVEYGKATVAFEATDQHYNPMGTLHGGVLCDISDFAMGIAYASTLGKNETFTTIELKINFLKRVTTGRLTAMGTVVKRGSTLGLVQCDVTNEAQDLVARATSTCITLRSQQNPK
jgi:uncharacterized protein (TIGR00369 family)